MKKILLTLMLACAATGINAQIVEDFLEDATYAEEAVEEEDFTPFYKYRVYLKDKKGTPYSIKKPEAFLSKKAIDRRKKQKLKINETDLPVNPAYLSAISDCGVEVLHTSKWNNTALVSTTDTTLMEKVAALSCVTGVRKVAEYTNDSEYINPDRQEMVTNLGGDPEEKSFISGLKDDLISRNLSHSYSYGGAYNQIKQMNGLELHQAGYRGEGMTIAIIDGGFQNADYIPYFKNVKILGTKDFAKKGGNVYDQEDHGTMVLSCIGGNTRGQIIGTAPGASFWLLRSEDNNTEQLVEEDNWCAAIEYADSVGADLVNTSLGYYDFDNKADNPKYHELDGESHIVSKSASMVASKGMVLCCSAGNEGNDTWKLITCPADAKDVLTVGAVTPDGDITSFSSLGNAADGRIKPDVCAQGEDCTLIDGYGDVTTAAGTSFASPIMCGMVACYWQANPKLTSYEVIKNVKALGNYAEHPNNIYGWGVPNFGK